MAARLFLWLARRSGILAQIICTTQTLAVRPAPVALLVASRYALPGYGDRQVWVRGPGLPDHLCQVIALYALRLNSQAGTEGSTVSSLNCNHWLILGA